IDDFVPLRDGILDQLLMLESGPSEYETCFHCDHVGTHRCVTCSGNRVLCSRCMVSTHATLPFHFIEYWNMKYWEKSTLQRLGFTLHLGHNGATCPLPDGVGRVIHVLHCTGLHDVRVVFCGCHQSGLRFEDDSNINQLLRARLFPATPGRVQSAVTFECLNEFHILTTQGKLTAMDYYETLVRLTDNTGKKYDEFLRCARLWRHLTMVKRAAVFLTGGVNNCKPGSCAVPCYACPSDVDKLTVAGLFEAVYGDPWWTNTDFRQLDANFRLKLKQRGLRDEPLNNGCAYIVRDPPYHAHLDACGPQTEINICDSGLHAVDHANLRGGAAYIASGVGACQCRHMMVMPGGVGDLQKGEKYSNMDYIFASASRCAKGDRMVVSYDIACQWHRNLASRCEALPEHVSFDPVTVDLEYVIPKFHISAHGSKCQGKFSLNFRRYMGRTDGENIERGWAWMNPASLSTREMGPGSRADTLDDQWGAFNFATLTRLGECVISRRLHEAARQAKAQRLIHEQMSASFPPSVVAEWASMVDAWAANPSDESLPNPFDEPEPNVTVADVRRELNNEEEAELARGVVPDHAVSSSKFILTGLQLEDQQRALKAQPSVPQTSTTRALGLEDKELELKRKIVQWIRQVQPVYMPNLRATEQNTGDESDSDNGDDAFGCSVWDIELRLPSSLSPADRTRYCVAGLIEKETRLRLTQADDALVDLRRTIRTVTTLREHRTTQTSGTGVAANTRMQSLIARHKRKEGRIAERYRAARKALLSLDPEGSWTARLLELKPEDCRPAHPEKKSTSKTSKGDYGATTGQGTYVTPWIWLTGGLVPPAPGETEAEVRLDEGVRSDWARSLARAERWEEEVILVPIEMRRVLRGLTHKAHWWRATVDVAHAPTFPILAGYRAYSLKQADVCDRLAQSFASLWIPLLRKWSIPIPTGWPSTCLEVKNFSTHGVIRRLPWLSTARSVTVLNVSGPTPAAPDVNTS
ncbi:hypothetical protein SCHPADRAFT_826309, partial [Schizopora paradoxa]